MVAASKGSVAAGSAVPTREFQFSAADFERVRQLIYRHAGIALAPAKQDMVYSRLARRLRALGYASFAQYVVLLERDDAQERQIFINSLTTNLTSFFREAHHFECLAQQMERSSARPFRIWCSAASTGEEAYSLAMTACEAWKSMTPPVEIIASDIDTAVLATARQGSYPTERLDRLSRTRVQQFFRKDGGSAATDGMVSVRPEVQKLVSFTPINLLAVHWPLEGPFDAIFCRNVMIYFDKPTQYGILKRFVPLLRTGGLLYAGHAESFLHATDLFRPLGRTVYECVDQ
jgi:chemotaxis protein methyltransferase CheR